MSSKDEDKTWESEKNLNCEELIKELESKRKEGESKKMKKKEMEKKEEKENEIEKPKEKEKTERVRERTLSNSTLVSCAISDAGPSEERKKATVSAALPNQRLPEQIINITNSSGHLIYWLKWKGIEEAEPISALEVTHMCPQIVIEFYEERIAWNSDDYKNESKRKKLESKGKKKEKEKEKTEHVRKCTSSNSTLVSCALSDVELSKELKNKTNADSFPYGKVPEKIIGANHSCDHIMFLLKWKGVEEASLISSEILNEMCPQIVIKFYEGIIKWPSPDNKNGI